MNGMINHKVSGKNALKTACPPMGNVTVTPGCGKEEKMEMKGMKKMKMKGYK